MHCRYLTLANRIHTTNDRPWVNMDLSCSYRLTGNIASFVNEVMLQKQHIKAVKDKGPSVRYLRMKPYAQAYCVADKIIELIRKENVPPSDIFVLAGSIKTKAPNAADKPSANRKSLTPMQVADEILAKANIPIFVPTDDESVGDQAVVKGKVTFSTFHQSKGLERKYVFVWGFHQGYFKYFNAKGDDSICPNELYVAATRASHSLYLLAEDEGDEKNMLKFLDSAALMRLRDQGVVEMDGNITTLNRNLSNATTTETVNYIDDVDAKVQPVTELTRHIPAKLLARSRSMLTTKVISEPGK